MERIGRLQELGNQEKDGKKVVLADVSDRKCNWGNKAKTYGSRGHTFI